jgi:methionyl aminopeptidase
MEKIVLDKYKMAGKIASEVREQVLKIIKPGLSLLQLANFIEEKIKEKGGQLAFPVNISINEIAAHDTPSINDSRIISDCDVVKIDIGVHIDGYIGDLAFTWCSKPNPMIEAVNLVLQKAIDCIRPGITVAEISDVIEKTIKKCGYGPIVNLTGHTLDRWQFHGQPSIPNVTNNQDYQFKSGDVIAIEPFLAQTAGYVKESSRVEIFRYIEDKPVRSLEARQILAIARERHGLPLAKRWLNISQLKTSLALKQLEAVGAIQTFPVLKEVENKSVVQAEHTVIVMDEPIVTTK